MLGLLGVKLSNEELELVFHRVANGASTGNYLEIINELRGQMSETREGAVIALFRDLDEANRNRIHSTELSKWFRAENHPDIRDKHATAQSIKNDFVDKLDLFGRLGVGIFYSGI